MIKSFLTPMIIDDGGAQNFDMETPICSFINRYILKNPVRAHMPGHKGREIDIGSGINSFSQIYKYDITEIDGADYLSAPCGIIAESERNASKLFGSRTYYSAEGSSLCIRAMLYLVKKKAEKKGKKTRILAGRNSHATFLNAAALLNIDVDWIMPLTSESYESCTISGTFLEKYFSDILTCTDNPESENEDFNQNELLPDAVYITTPDYLGNMLDISGIAKVCHKYGILLVVDNAHGAYLKFIENSKFPIDLGADMCCSSAHKTLPVLTGGAYLHINEKADPFFGDNARGALSVFASTSPSYIILQSLDLCNDYLERMAIGEKVFDKMSKRIDALKENLRNEGFILQGDEPLKLTLTTGSECDADRQPSETMNELTGLLADEGIFIEYCDSKHLVMMLGPQNTENDILLIEAALKKYKNIFNLTKSDARSVDSENKSDSEYKSDSGIYPESIERLPKPIQAMPFMKALMSESEMVDAEKSIGRVLAAPILNCPPCVPVYMCGEIINEDILKYHSGRIAVVAETGEKGEHNGPK